MKSIFGMTFVAEDNETAKIIAFDNKIYNCNCVTLDGDAYRSDGILSGGSNS
jgi:structural maintenance of chromosome 2